MIDRAKLETLLSRLRRYRGYLEDLASIPCEDLLMDVGRLGGVKYYFQVAVECCIDICNYIVAAKEAGGCLRVTPTVLLSWAKGEFCHPTLSRQPVRWPSSATSWCISTGKSATRLSALCFMPTPRF